MKTARLLLVLGGVLLSCSSSGSSGTSGPGSPDGGAGPGPGGGSVPSELVGSWYAGAGGTTAPYNPSTGAWGTPSGKGLVYVLEANASYTKAFQSYNSAGGCTNGFTAFESGVASANASTLTLTPRSGHMKVSDSCAPSLDSDDPLKELTTETFTWTFEEDTDGTRLLRLTAPDGATSAFRPL